jgi:PAP2 superfamily protein
MQFPSFGWRLHSRVSLSRSRTAAWRLTLLAALTLLSVHAPSRAQTSTAGEGNRGFLGIDRFDEGEARGIYSRPNQKRIDSLVILTMGGVALWEGTDSRLGKTMWESIDASVTGGLSTEVLKRVFQRPRPSQNNDPRVWFDGSGHRSFPSGETALMASFVTPLILEYHDDYPATWALAALPLYMGKARMAAQGHWLTDVLGGAALGVTAGVLAHDREQPLVLRLTNHGVFVGLKTRF